VRSLVELALWAHAAVEMTSRSARRKEVLMIGLRGTARDRFPHLEGTNA